MGVSERQSPPTPLNLMGYKGGEGASGGLFRMGWGSHLRAPSRPPPPGNAVRSRRPRLLLPRDPQTTTIALRGGSVVLECIAEGL